MDQARRELAHLLRRAGFGATPAELDAAVRLGYDTVVDRLLHPEAVEDAEAPLADLDETVQPLEGLRLAWLTRMLHTRRPLQEKLVLFWHGQLPSAAAKLGARRAPALLDQQLTLFREHALGNWRALLRAISRDPAMLVYLDNRLNRKGAPNENYARELLELFTLGIGNYDEHDVQEAARAFTGWTLDREGRFTLNARQHDDGLKTIFGRTGPWTGDDVIDLILEQPAAARFLAARLFRFFAYDDPAPEVIERLATRFRNSDYDLRVLVEAILRSPEFRSERAYRAHIKSPVEFAIGTLKLLGAEAVPRDLPASLRRMGQDLLNPPSVKGWDGGPAWINATTLLERFNFANRLVSARGEHGTSYLDIDSLVRQHPTPEALVDHFADLFLDGDLPPASRATLLAYMQDGPAVAADPDAADRKIRGLVHLVLASPLYQLG
ncbi:MAG TPA: DUF1800 domain-containing protein [Chloroflexota bacterium]|nr:DUF1800 domain-containing protein [Chloroflexota bacterium]HZU05581.1 DUF1800 domain-containing protein [Chloroflexota bacterium]